MKHFSLPPLIAALAALSAGCAAQPPASGRNRAPVETVKAAPMDPQHPFAALPATAAPTDGDNADYLAAASVPVRTLSCLLPLRIATDRAWALTDESVLPAPTRALWHGNGLRLGYLPEAKWEDFRSALNGQEKNAKTNAGVMAQQIASFTLRPFPEPLHKGGPLPRGLALPLDKTLPPFAPNGEPLPVFDGDRAQLMALAAFDGKNFAGLTLTPHLHHPLPILGFDDPLKGPPKAWEKEAQGTSITALSTAPLHPPAGKLLVVGLWWPWKIEKPEGAPESKADEKAEKTADADKPKEQPKEKGKEEDGLTLSATPPPLPLSIGRAMFTSYQNGGEFQLILLVKVK